MKNKFVLLVSCFTIFIVIGCNCALDESSKEFADTSSMAISLNLSSTSSKISSNARNLMYKIFLYKGALSSSGAINSDSLQFEKEEDWKSYEDFKNYQFVISGKEFRENIYKLVVVAGISSEELIIDAGPIGTNLSDFKISRKYDSDKNLVALTRHNYISSAVISKSDVACRKIDLNFERIVGQLIFDVGKYDSNSTPMPLDDGFNSTLDRVKTITMIINHHTNDFYFFREKNKTVVSAQSETIKYDFSTWLEPKTYKMIESNLQTPPDGSAGILCNSNDIDIIPNISVGGTRLYGPFQLENEDSNFSVNIDFQYYDTFIDNSLKNQVLRLPQSGKTLKVINNNYTTTKIKITENRIIDITTDFGDVKFDHTWN